MPQTNFRRTLVGDMSGVAVNIPVDTTDRLAPNEADGVFASVLQLSRGRIDRPFLVDKSEFGLQLGTTKSVRVNPANEALIQVFEALQTGASGCVVSRVHSKDAKLKWIVVKHSADKDAVFELSESKPENTDNTWSFAFRIKNAINAGVWVVMKADKDTGYVHLEIFDRLKDDKNQDTSDGTLLYTIDGNVSLESLNEFGEADDLETSCTRFYTDEIEWAINTPENAKILDNDAWTEEVTYAAEYFEDNGQLTADDFVRAADALGATSLQYRYIMVSSQSIPLIQRLIEIGIQYSRKVKIDINGTLSPDAAISFKKQFNYKAQEGMYTQWLWAPLKRDDPSRVSGNVALGTVGLQIGYSCARNMAKNAYGLEALNQPIAGKEFMLRGTRITQFYFPTDTELAALAKEHINPVVFEEYHDGAGFVFSDSLSGAKKLGVSKLESASEISIWAENTWGKYSNSLRQLPMTEAIRRANIFTADMLSKMEASGWLTVSSVLGSAYAFNIYPNKQYPDDRLEIELALSIDGVVRRVTVSQKMYSRS